MTEIESANNSNEMVWQKDMLIQNNKQWLKYMIYINVNIPNCIYV